MYRYRHAIRGRKLTLRLLRSNSPPSHGVSDDVFQVAFYEASPFFEVD